MKVHIGLDVDSGLVRSVIGAAANVNEATQAGGLLHRHEQVVFGGAGYRGVAKRLYLLKGWNLSRNPGRFMALM
jgi:IS5 family transposase